MNKKNASDVEDVRQNDLEEDEGLFVYNNIGHKIKGLATASCILGIVWCAIVGIIIMANGNNYKDFFFGVFVALVGSLLSWIYSFALYGFGQLIENSDTLVQQVQTIIKNNANIGCTDNEVSVQRAVQDSIKPADGKSP